MIEMTIVTLNKVDEKHLAEVMDIAKEIGHVKVRAYCDGEIYYWSAWRWNEVADIWTGEGIWEGWRLTKDHQASSYGQPVLVDPDGIAYGPGDIRKRVYQADVARWIGATPAAVTGRINRGTLPPYDGVDERGRGFWYYGTIKDVLERGGAE